MNLKEFYTELFKYCEILGIDIELGNVKNQSNIGIHLNSPTIEELHDAIIKAQTTSTTIYLHMTPKSP